MHSARLSLLAGVSLLLLCTPQEGRAQWGGGFFGGQGFGGGFGGLGGRGARGFQPRTGQPFLSYAEFYGRLSGRSRTPMIPGIGGGLPTVPLPTNKVNPLLRELGLDDRQKIRRRESTDPVLRRWPTWVDVGGAARQVERVRGETEDRPQASECYFVRMSDRVELRPSGEKGYYPLQFWDTARRLGIGSRVRLSGRGRALMIFSDGTQVELIESGEVGFVQGTIDRLVLELSSVTRAFVRLGSRGVEIRMPDASVLRGRQSSFEIQRQVQDTGGENGGAPADRLAVTNWGPDPLRLEAPVALRNMGADNLELAPRRRLLLALVTSDAGREPLAEDLPKTIPGGGIDLRAGVHATVRKDRRGLAVEARSGDAVLRWGGTRLRVPLGTTLRIDPLLGDPFQEGRSR